MSAARHGVLAAALDPKDLHRLAASIASLPVSLSLRPNPYVVVSGLTGSGKTTLLRAIRNLWETGHPTGKAALVDEKALHSPFVDQLFSAPSVLGFELQLSFMISRATLVRRCAAAGVGLFMERGHLEDLAFIRQLRDDSTVTELEYETYVQLWETLAHRLPTPDIMVVLDVTAETAVGRLLLQLEAEPGQRPPIASVDVFAKRVAAWHRHYRQRIAEIAAKPPPRMNLIYVRPEEEFATVAQRVVAELP